MRGNIVVAGAIVGVAIFIGSLILWLGVAHSINAAADRLDAGLHSNSQLLAGSVDHAGELATHASVTMEKPIAIRDPVHIAGTQAPDFALPINARLAK